VSKSTARTDPAPAVLAAHLYGCAPRHRLGPAHDGFFTSSERARAVHRPGRPGREKSVARGVWTCAVPDGLRASRWRSQTAARWPARFVIDGCSPVPCPTKNRMLRCRSLPRATGPCVGLQSSGRPCAVSRPAVPQRSMSGGFIFRGRSNRGVLIRSGPGRGVRRVQVGPAWACSGKVSPDSKQAASLQRSRAGRSGLFDRRRASEIRRSAPGRTIDAMEGRHRFATLRQSCQDFAPQPEAVRLSSSSGAKPSGVHARCSRGCFRPRHWGRCGCSPGSTCSGEAGLSQPARRRSHSLSRSINLPAVGETRSGFGPGCARRDPHQARPSDTPDCLRPSA
jgi:hypothetical protein